MTPADLVNYVRSIRVHGRKLTGAEREAILAECAVKAMDSTSKGFTRAMPISEVLPIKVAPDALDVDRTQAP